MAAQVAPRTRARQFRFGPLLAGLGALLVLVAFCLPWVAFRDVVAGSTPSIAGYQLPGFVRNTLSLVALLAGQRYGGSSTLALLLWLVPLLAGLSLLLALLAVAGRRTRRTVGVLHALIAAVGLRAAGWTYWQAEAATTGASSVLSLVGPGLWLTLLGLGVLLLGGVTEMLNV